MTRIVTVGAGQLGPVNRADTREVVVERLIALLEQAAARSCDLIVFPELALTTFFPRWYTDDVSDHDHYYEVQMPSPATQPLFDAAKRLGVGFCLGYQDSGVANNASFNRRQLGNRICCGRLASIDHSALAITRFKLASTTH